MPECLSCFVRVSRSVVIPLAFFALLCPLAGSQSLAAEFSYGGYKNKTLLIEGEIVEGDADRLHKLVVGKPGQKLSSIFYHVALNSPGGSVVESLRMAALLAGLKVSTVVPKSKACASACFFLFLAGEPREVETSGRLGLHRPFLSKEFFNSVDSEDATKSQSRLMKEVSAYLESMMVPRQLIEMMMNRPSTEVYWMTGKDIESLGEYAPEREELFTAKCGYDRRNSTRALFSEFFNNVLKNKEFRELMKDQPPYDEVENDAKVEKQNEAIRKTEACINSIQFDEKAAFFANLQAGWKPWAGTARLRKKYSGSGKWFRSGGNVEVSFFFDPATIRRNGSIAEMWALLNYKSAQTDLDGPSFFSMTATYEFSLPDPLTAQILRVTRP